MTKTLVCTIVTKNYLAYARALAVSLAAHNPGLELYVLLADRNDGEIDPDQESFHLIPLEALADQASVQRMCFYYTAFELCCALRGLLHEYILNHTDAERWIFLDSDIYVCGSLEPVFEQLRSAAILLTPHSQTPASIEQSVVCEVNNLIRCGLYNAGFLGLRRCETTRQFIAWWKTRLEHFCFDDVTYQNLRGLFVDQLWLNLVPLYFVGVQYLSNLGCNLGYWNLWERPLNVKTNGAMFVGSEPLRFIHFSGWNFDDPQRVSKHSFLDDNLDQPIWGKLGLAYRDLLVSQGYKTLCNLPYSFTNFATGETITQAMRRAYYDDWQSGQAIDQPFSQASFFLSRTYEPGNSVRLLWQKIVEIQQQVSQAQTAEAQAWQEASRAQQSESQAWQQVVELQQQSTVQQQQQQEALLLTQKALQECEKQLYEMRFAIAIFQKVKSLSNLHQVWLQLRRLLGFEAK
ncbi:hypothetical protein ACN4EG_01085 [Alkalinema pantanalense CENA528]|uniref:hypothetical protein n=1 Tax=Alkalinema pantanalense TaxID=1620705 RepID=UPI003D6E63D1